MKKYLKVSFIISLIIMVIFIPMLFLIKYELYNDCLVFEKQEKQYVIISDKTYKQLQDLKNIKLKNNDHLFQFTTNKWSYHKETNNWYTAIMIKENLTHHQTKIFLKNINILGF